ncbi:hypothetical protein NU688_30030 [Variovorax sp. ZS18.2.2]|uniref:hypothetical protein n=1 Tax=Variovorax sp. ZS18.2.2 TaxID=2971255 RepID=UPI002151A144|nr:hypothetical protein [Variovorax sp. ZS18.2.2]MCR6480426.1 hypothetical protein [Variovorax sp. ZS18.2.2]
MLSNNPTAFAARFRQAMQRKGLGSLGATQLAEALAGEFPDILSVQTTHKWLNGTAVPRPERLSVLARWLDVSEHWLAYGPDPSLKGSGLHDGSARTSSAKDLTRRIHQLSEPQRGIIELLLSEFERSAVA